jgi:hypothetical protein
MEGTLSIGASRWRIGRIGSFANARKIPHATVRTSV